MFKKIFGGGSGNGKSSGQPSVATTTRTVNAVQQLGDTEELLTKRRDLLEKKVAAELQRAKELNVAKNKKGALASLRKKKLLEKQLEDTENNIQRIIEQKGMLEEQQAQVVQIQAMRKAAEAGKATKQELDIDSVDKVLGEINDQADHMAQIQDAMAQPIGTAAALDDDELLAELEDMEAQELDDQLLEPAPVPSTKIPAQAAAQTQAMPNVPSRKIPQKPAKTPEELELEQLEAEMAQ